MSPRKTRYRIPEWQVKQLRDRRKKILYGPYTCPKCNQDKLRIRVNKQNKKVTAICDCGLEYSFKYVSSYEPVDYYNKLIDQFHE